METKKIMKQDKMAVERKTAPLNWKAARSAMLTLEHDCKSDYKYEYLLIIAVGFYTGYRISDLRVLRFTDFNGKNVTLTERKTSKQRIIPVIPELKRIVNLCREEMKKKESDYLFTRMRFNSPKPISKVSMISRIRTALIEAGIKEKNLSGHTLRKTFALKYFDILRKKYGDERALIQTSEILNHSDTKTTRLYLNLSEQAKREAFEIFASDF